MQLDPFTLAIDALLRPARYAAVLSGGRAHIMRAGIAAAIWCGAGLALVALVMGQLLPLGRGGLSAALLTAPLLTLMIAGILIAITGATLPSAIAVPFWLTRCAIAITPPLALLLGLGASTAAARVPGAEQAAVLLLLAGCGAWIGSGIVVTLLLSGARKESASFRLVLGGGALAIGALLAASSALRSSDAPLIVPLCAGIAAAMLRPLSWAWQSALSLSLLVASRLGLPASQAAGWSPTQFDELSVLPLPGLADLLARACAEDSDEGTEQLIAAAGHAGQGDATVRALNLLIRRGQHAHPVLFRLSTHPRGPDVLTQMADRSTQVNALVAAYAALATVDDQGAWGATLRQRGELLATYQSLPGGQALWSLVLAGRAVLSSEQIDAAEAALASVPTPRDVAPDQLWYAVEHLITWARSRAAGEGDAPDGWRPSVEQALEETDGWPARLLAAVAEHLDYLEQLESPREAVP